VRLISTFEFCVHVAQQARPSADELERARKGAEAGLLMSAKKLQAVAQDQDRLRATVASMTASSGGTPAGPGGPSAMAMTSQHLQHTLNQLIPTSYPHGNPLLAPLAAATDATREYLDASIVQPLLTLPEEHPVDPSTAVTSPSAAARQARNQQLKVMAGSLTLSGQVAPVQDRPRSATGSAAGGGKISDRMTESQRVVAEALRRQQQQQHTASGSPTGVAGSSHIPRVRNYNVRSPQRSVEAK
jgi:hypothetical protein